MMQCKDPKTGKTWFFIEKCLPFRASISCARFQLFSDSLKHVIKFLTGRYFSVTNYLDDYLFISADEEDCNAMVRRFLSFCQDIRCPVSLEKTEWASSCIIFLGLLLNGQTHSLAVPCDKKLKAQNLLTWAIQKRKVTIHFIQRLTGTLNFLNKAIVPGRTFLRAMYSKLKLKNTSSEVLKPFHHVNLDKNFISDCKIWQTFLNTDKQETVLCRPFLDVNGYVDAHTLKFYSDSSLNRFLGMGTVFENRWIAGAWGPEFILNHSPSIQFLELFALVAAVLTWNRDPRLHNTRIKIFCDNKSVRDMVNNSFSNCHQCMKLIRMLVLDNMRCNRRVFVEYIESKKNILADALSRFEFDRFWKHTPATMSTVADTISPDIWPPEKIWFKEY